MTVAQAELAVHNGTPYVAWDEGGAVPQIYVAHWNGSAWIQNPGAGPSGSLNRIPTQSSIRLEITFVGSTPYVALREFDVLNNRRQFYVKALE